MGLRMHAARLRYAVTAILLGLLVSPALADDDDKKEKKKGLNPAKLLGDWSYVSGKRAGESVPEERLVGTVTITKETFTLPAGPTDKFVMAYKIDKSKTPAHIDMKIKSGPVDEGEAKGIIKMEDGKVMYCYDALGGERPKKFESTKENGFHMFVLKKKKED